MPSTGCCSEFRLRRFFVFSGVLLVTLSLFLIFMLRNGTAPPEPVYGGMTLHQWIRAEPHQPVTSHDDIVNYRRTAFRAMGEPAIRYLHWMIAYPERSLEQHVTATERLRRRLPQLVQRLIPTPAPRRSADFRHVVFSLGLIGSEARAAAPDLARLWESDGNAEYASYNGFPFALAELGDGSGRVIAALHRHLSSKDPLHAALCAFAAWRLKPTDQQAIALLRHYLTSPTVPQYVRNVLLDEFGRLGPDAKQFFPELRVLVATNITTESARAAWRMFGQTRPAEGFVRQLAGGATKSDALPADSDRFAAMALSLAEVPGVAEFAAPVLKQLTLFTNASSAAFASNILDRIGRKLP